MIPHIFNYTLHILTLKKGLDVKSTLSKSLHFMTLINKIKY